MSRLSFGPIILSVAFAVVVVVFVAELLYVLWRRRVFRDQVAAAATSGSDHLESSPDSKDILYFLWWKQQQPRVDTASIEGGTGRNQAAPDGLENTPATLPSINAQVAVTTETASAEESFRTAEDGLEVSFITEGDIEATLFPTACDSPFYCTPSASPSRGDSNEKTLSFVT